jgi:hypothetical protein
VAISKAERTGRGDHQVAPRLAMTGQSSADPFPCCERTGRGNPHDNSALDRGLPGQKWELLAPKAVPGGPPPDSETI